MINENNKKNIETFDELTNLSDYSFIENLNSDPDANQNGDNKYPREIFSGHYVPVSKQSRFNFRKKDNTTSK